MPKKKTNEEFLAELKEKRGNDYTPLEDYKGNQTKINIKHNICGEILFIRPKDLLVNGVKCSYCSGNTKLSYEDMKKFIEVESNSGCKLLSDKIEIENSQSYIHVLCNCGEKFKTTFRGFKHDNKRQCNECGFENGANTKRNSYEYVKSVVESKGIKLISKEYVDNKTELELLCEHGHLYRQTFNDLIGGHECGKCYEESLNGYSKTNVYSWLRTVTRGWIKESKKHIEYKCAITNGTDDLELHHLHSFNLIVKETFEILDLPILENYSCYNEKEQQLIRNKFIELHHKYGYGVWLTRKVHILYHQIYRFTNTKEQFDEFRNRYDNGEFDELLSIINN